jgi:hypothetical protein
VSLNEEQAILTARREASAFIVLSSSRH